MSGIVVQVSISPGGLPKKAINGGAISELGVEGDQHAHPQFHGGPKKAVLLISAEVIDGLKERGYPVFPGALGENITTRGIDLGQLAVGSRLRAGQALLEITSPRSPCSQLDVYGSAIKNEIYDARVKALEAGSPRWGMSGLYASVIEPGSVCAGDIIAIVR